MRAFKALILLSFIYLSKSSLLCDGSVSASSYDECNALKLPEGADHCCFIELKYESISNQNNNNICAPITKEDYSNIDNWKKKFKDEKEKNGLKVGSLIVNCGNPKQIENSKSPLKASLCDDTKDPPFKDYCSYFQYNADHCCYLNVVYNKGSETRCISITNAQYADLESYKEELKQNYENTYGGVTTFELVCSGDDKQTDISTDKTTDKTTDTPKITCEDKTNPSSANDCNNLSPSYGKDYCCYLSYKITYSGKEMKEAQCQSYDEAEYVAELSLIEEIKKQMEEEGGKVDYYKLVCKNGGGGDDDDGGETIPEESCGTAYSKEQCFAYNTIGSENRCCYFYYKVLKNSNYKEQLDCLSFTEEEYKLIPEMIKNQKELLKKEGYSIAKFSLDCHAENVIKSIYIIASILALALFL